MCSASSVRALDTSGQPIASSMAARSPGDDRNHSPPRHREANLLAPAFPPPDGRQELS